MKKVQGLEVPTTMTELRDALLVNFAEVENGHIKLPLAKERANIAGKVIKSAMAQLEYAGLRKEKPEIPFLR